MRTAALMPSVASAWAITKRPAAVASSTSTSSSASRKWPWRGSSRGDSTPPLVATLMTSAPARTSSRTLRRVSSGPSTIASGWPGWATKNAGMWAPQTCQSSPWPPVWLSIEIEICIRGPAIMPALLGGLEAEVRAARFAHRRDAASSVARMFSAASKNASENGRAHRVHGSR